jgi:DNA polymerase III epsilon subunit-like protein
MATIKGKPTGYFEKLLVMDAETTGLAFNSDDPSYDPRTCEEYQAVSWGLIVADSHTLNPIEELYVEVQWNGDSVWSPKAEAIHGLSKDYLLNNGVGEDEAVAQIANFVIKHWGPEVSIRALGHNVATFDIWFMKRMCRRHGIELKFGNRNIDTSTVGFVNYEVYTSDQLFELMGYDPRGDHNALEDAHMSLASARMTRQAMQAALGS